MIALWLFACEAPPVAEAPGPTPQPPAPTGELVLKIGGPTGFLAPPPVEGSPELAADWAGVRAAATPERVALARRDAALDPFAVFRSVFGKEFTAEHHPATARLLKAIADAEGPAINRPKDFHKRPRPFVADPTVGTCTAPSEALRESGSYPSGHAAVGWSWALVLVELVPSRADALVKRGIEYGDSRVVCGLHFPSDVRAGRDVGAAALGRLHAEPEFRAALDAAYDELAGYARP